ncbi:choline transporter-like protein 4 [Eurytemora carolleeae]|uniref:choline transporter-like protein 4 n=1 Tax=Eurytemora carolleeae TaxID=1294199 RepID=UPI000C7834E4|nr:choline transporter-like protein 4 [Eurytemora carolleeae]|eukprot:XP_023337592.1 choline transporter-like protein 4 [Eurytemora affinis]
MVLAGCFSSWYWAFNKSKDVPSFPIISSFYRAFRYHLGSLAFGSLIIAILRMIRLAIQYVEEKIKEKGLDNPATKVILCLCKCCFWCLEKFMKFLNRNAYIITASYGYNFCKSAKVTDFLLLLGKLVVTGSLAVLSFYIFSERNENAENPQYCMSKNLMKILNLKRSKKSTSKKSD